MEISFPVFLSLYYDPPYITLLVTVLFVLVRPGPVSFKIVQIIAVQVICGDYLEHTRYRFLGSVE